MRDTLSCEAFVKLPRFFREFHFGGREGCDRVGGSDSSGDARGGGSGGDAQQQQQQQQRRMAVSGVMRVGGHSNPLIARVASALGGA